MPEPLSPFRRLVIAEPGTVRIEVRRGGGEPSLWAVVNVEDWDLIGQIKWYEHVAQTTSYAISSRGGSGARFMHQLILPAPEGMEVDHVDHDGLNNRRSNLRLATRTQNLQNRRAHRARNGVPTSSAFKGVCWSKRSRGWVAYITVNGKREHLGYYSTEIGGARAYDRRAREAFGSFALLNFPEDVAS